jgi:hypothetical protein
MDPEKMQRTGEAMQDAGKAMTGCGCLLFLVPVVLFFAYAMLAAIWR